MSATVILDGAWAAIGRRGGGRTSIEATELGAISWRDRFAIVLVGVVAIIATIALSITPIGSGSVAVLLAISCVVAVALQCARLAAELHRSEDELRASRGSVAADQERERIESDLHDGAQQQLIALRIRLGLLEELGEANPAVVTAGLSAAGEAVESALATLRDLAHGVYPAVLRHGGLGPALNAVARNLPLPIRVQARGLGRFAHEVETGVYFCCLEALQNAAKHGGDRRRVDVRLSAAPDELHFEVTDHRPGFDPSASRDGTGIIGMHDRLGAIGGQVEIVSTPGQGTTVAGRVPICGVGAPRLNHAASAGPGDGASPEAARGCRAPWEGAPVG